MGRRDTRHSPGGPRKVRRAAAALAVVALVAAGGVVLSGEAEPTLDRVRAWGEDLLGEDPDPRTEPAEVEPPDGLGLPDVEPPAAPAVAVGARPVSATAVRRAVSGPLGQPVLGRRVGVAVAGLTGETAYDAGPEGLVPASTTKLLTAFAALDTIDPGTRFATRALLDGTDLVLVGGGDPLLQRAPDLDAAPGETQGADLTTLARRTAEALADRGVRRVRLGYDDGLFSGPAFNRTWPATYRDFQAPITALMVDDGSDPDGFGRVADPSRAAAEVYAAALRRAGVQVLGVPSPAAASAGADLVAEVESAPIGSLVEQLVRVSDNETAETVLRHVGLATGGAGSTQDGVAGVREVLEERGVPAPLQLRDGSGLSRENLIGPDTLVGLLQAVAGSASDDPVRGLLPGLPVAGFSGSLAFRFDDAPPAAVGRVRAKTGTLAGVRSLSGVVVARDGTPMVFALMADRIPGDRDEEAEALLDRAAAALAACRCGRVA
ncbi:unannotated protein [freshwater metagenome]|uniref:Unannotated protein n=1 Tax=freshwater metagenome TaxID=449393 RepID=A0A6J6VAH4_9ZZZZ|nr:D-alanyl-D-alanine carboxypeptidase/D-alanyl-D-alanine-endopeptidase [Actinomycetota bacterium]